MTQPIHWNAEALWEAIAPQLPGFTVEVLPTIGSSNTELMRRARDGLTEPVLLIAEQQTQGRGRLGRNWVSGVGDSLMFSLGLPLAPRDWSGLSLAVGVSVAESLQPHLPAAGSATPRIGIKWPNDLWLEGDCKLAGILIETASFVGTQQHDMTAPRYVVIGIGINVRPRPGDGMRTAPACLQELDAALDAPTALACILPNLVAEVQSFARHGFAPLMQRFAQRDLLAGREVNLSDGTSGMAQGVAADGGFLVRTAAGLQAVTSSEISVRPASSPLQD
ncbi:Bifunctional ligase/repressor BirA [Comamonas sp. PE63]|uniref:biotin--[biotin carboxyl-carrier protein] ligase n=1 Tax=Comamonas brasiliensis TaxID=1812482 RepID=A0ABS5LWE8_9BURK|nr:biotin--[acetyl-CoA-carboxylase] ligase [Comamonas sp. PE63]MBS3020821.1 Bifunctional ligase/repressor BirA [Comamonas sp. PE63]